MYFLIYTLALYENMLDVLKVFNHLFIIITIMGAVFSVFFYTFLEELPDNSVYMPIKPYLQILPKLKTYYFMVIGLIFINIVLPKPIYTYTMAGVFLGEQLKENTQATTLFDKSVEALELKLDKTIKELTEETKKESR